MLNTVETGQNVAKHPGVQTGLKVRNPQIRQEKETVYHPPKHTVRKIITGTIVAASIVAYANFHEEVNDYFVDFMRVNGLVRSSEATEPTETIPQIDNLIIPEDLIKEDSQVRESVKKMIEDGNSLDLDITEVKKYLLTGETKDLNTFKVIKDAQGNPAFIVVKGGDNGFNEKSLAYVGNAVNRLNEIDPTIIRTMADKHNLKFVATNTNGEFEKHPNWMATYRNPEFGGLILLNPKIFGINVDNIEFGVIGALITESRAIYTTSKGTDSLITNAPDKLDENIGIDKALFLSSLSKKWFNENKIDSFSKEYFSDTATGIINYYSKSE